jgi:hypothetical protein
MKLRAVNLDEFDSYFQVQAFNGLSSFRFRIRRPRFESDTWQAGWREAQRRDRKFPQQRLRVQQWGSGRLDWRIARANGVAV